MKKKCSCCQFEKDHADFYEQKDGSFQNYCKICLLTFQKDRWRARKARAVALFGGKCTSCGYNRNLAAFDFHHLDPAEKEFGWGQLKKKSWDKIVAELKKCILLCRNCHAELHNPHFAVDLISDADANNSLEERLTSFISTGDCPECGQETYGTKYCSRECSHKSQRKVIRPTKEQLQKEIEKMSWVELGRKYNVSDNAVRKWAKRYKLKIK